jgi:HD-GYP domain-containing protein (c-di-GMP phosphodiesterase class II)
MGIAKRRRTVAPLRSGSPHRPLQRVPLGIVKPTAWSTVLGPAVFALLAIALLVYDHVHRQVTDIVFWFTVALVASIFVWLVSKTAAAVAREHGSTLVDRLTGLPSREKLDRDLAAALAPGAREPWVLVVIELEGLPAYNDSHGHAAGEELMRRFARALADGTGGPESTAYRVEASGFAVLARTGSSSAGEIVTAISAVSPQDDDENLIEISFGDVLLPAEAANPRLALEVAALRRRARKQRQRRSARGQLRQVLLEVVAARPELRNQTPDLAHWIIAVSHRLELQEQVDDMVLAAELRDIGLLTVPEATLAKRTPLSERERELLRLHPIAGQRILNAAPTLAPAAALVRAANEHFDGSGYPDGIAGTSIPVGARLIAVCVAFAEMTSAAERQAGLSSMEALEELERRAGTQFDPQIVGALAGVIRETPASSDTHLEPGRRQPPTSGSPVRSVPA